MEKNSIDLWMTNQMEVVGPTRAPVRVLEALVKKLEVEKGKLDQS